MKNYLLFAITFIFTTTLVAQELPQSILSKFQHHPQKHKTQYVIDGMVKMDSMQILYYIEGEMQEVERTLFEYTGQGQMQKTTYYELDFGSMNLLLADEDNYFYENGQLSYEVDYYYDHDLEIWIMDDSVSYTYQDGLLVQEDFYWYDLQNDEMDHDEITYYYYTEGILDSVLVTRWNGSEYAPDSKEVYLYTEGHISSYISSYYDVEFEEWSFEMKMENTWVSGKLMETIEFYFDEALEQWVNDSKLTYTWQTNGNLDEQINYIWNEETEIWMEEMKMYGYYNNAVEFSDMVLPFAEDEEGNPLLLFEHQVDSVYLDTYSETSWERAGTFKFHFSQYVGLNDPWQTNNLQVNMYPNPANNTLHVRTPFAQETQSVITDNLGRIVQLVNLEGERTINVSALPGGMYFLKINEGEYAGATFKFIVE